MIRSRFSFSLAVTSSIALAAIILPVPANAQLYSRGGRIATGFSKISADFGLASERLLYQRAGKMAAENC